MGKRLTNHEYAAAYTKAEMLRHLFESSILADPVVQSCQSHQEQANHIHRLLKEFSIALGIDYTFLGDSNE